MKTITDWIKSWWAYSRTLFLNVVAGVVPLIGELISYLSGVEWTSLVSNPRVAVAFSVGLTVMNIVLRFMTTRPVGQ